MESPRFYDSLREFLPKVQVTDIKKYTFLGMGICGLSILLAALPNDQIAASEIPKKEFPKPTPTIPVGRSGVPRITIPTPIPRPPIATPTLKLITECRASQQESLFNVLDHVDVTIDFQDAQSANRYGYWIATRHNANVTSINWVEPGYGNSINGTIHGLIPIKNDLANGYYWLNNSDKLEIGIFNADSRRYEYSEPQFDKNPELIVKEEIIIDCPNIPKDPQITIP